MKIKDLNLFDVPNSSKKGNSVNPVNEYIHFKKEDIEQSVAQRFQQQVDKYGEKLAVKVGDESLTYEELNRSANRVAHSVLENYDDQNRLNSNEKIRYSRQMMLHQWGIGAQEKLKSTTVFCAGAGGSGSPLIMQLALAGFGKIIICDFDEVELSNLNRQVLHDESRIGMNKALSAAKSVQQINPNIEIVVYQEKITRENMRQLAEGSDIIFDNVDDMEAKFVLSQYAVEKKIPHIISSMIDMNAYAAIFHSPHTPCFHCLNDRGVLDEVAEMKKVVKDYKKNPNPVVSPSLFLATAFAVNEAIKIVLGFNEQKSAYNKYFFFNQRGTNNIFNADSYRLITYSYGPHFRKISKEQGFDWDEGWSGGFLDEIELKHDPECPACSGKKVLEPLPVLSSSNAIEPIIVAPRSSDNYKTVSDSTTDLKSLKTVALLFEHGIQMIVGLIGVLKSGKVYVPLDPGYPEERLNYQLEDSGARLIVTNNKNYNLACQLRDSVNRNIVVVNVDAISTEDEMPGIVENNPNVLIAPRQPAYILYTSGSTGKPKGVIQNHRNILHFCRVYTNALHLNADDRLSVFSSYGFDAAKMDIYGALLNGGTLYPYDIKQDDNLSRMPQWLKEEAITIYHSIPTVYRYFTDMLTRVGEFPAIRFIVLGGEAVFKKDIETYRKFFSDDCLFINGLGPTESTVTLQYFMDKNTKITREAVPVGYAVDETEVILLDKEDRETVGTGIGEIVYKSDYLALGYYNNDEKTREVFVNNPLTGKDRVYRSGDLGRRLIDGSLEYAGRKDFQVKIRGYRVELGEIEGRLDSVAGIKKSAVVCKQDSNGENFLTAYYVVSEVDNLKVDVDEMDLVMMLQDSVPDYMVPSAFYLLEEFPLTATGKIDRKALAESSESQIASQVEFVPPEGPIETKLAEIWMELLNVDKVGVHDNFFVLGGHSLKATVLVSKIHKVFDVKVALAEIFKLRTIRELAKYIGSSVKDEFLELEKAPKMDSYPLSAAQSRMYIVQQLEESGTGYNLHSIVQLEGDINVEKLENTFRMMIQRHESFRTSFHMDDGNPVQKIHENIDFQLQHFEGPVDRVIKNAIFPFDLSQAPLLRVALITEAENRYVLVIDMHHIISDGISIILFVREFMALYGGEDLPPLKFQYKDYAWWKNSEKEQRAVQKQESYWLDRFGDELPVLELPYDFKRPSIQSFEGAALSFVVEPAKTRALNVMARKEDVTFYMLLTAIVNVWLAKLSQQEDIIIGTPLAGRRHTDLERIIGMFVNTLAIRNQPEGRLSFKGFLQRVKENTLKDFENQDYQFEDIVEKVSVQRDTSRNPIFDVSFRLQNLDFGVDDIPRVDIGDIILKPYRFLEETSKFDIGVTAREIAGSLNISLEYATRLFKESTIERFISIFKAIVFAVVKNPGLKLSDIEILSEEEKQQLLSQFNDTAIAYASEKTIHGLFAEQVGKYNQYESVVIHNQDDSKCLSVTYEELDKKSGQLASLLYSKGVTSGSIIGIFGERSLEMVVGILAVLKVGCTYLPIDIDYPEQRIKYMLDDCAVDLLLLPPKQLNMKCFGGETIIVDLENLETGIESTFESVNDHSIPAYVMYTSGSTGQPKGVLVSHKNVIRLVNNCTFVELSSETRILQTGAPVFDATTFEIWGSLLNGGQLILTDKEVILDAQLLNSVLRKYSINTLWLSSPLFNRLIQQDIDCLAPLSYLLVGGDVLSPSHINPVIRKYPQLKVINGYGPTENTTFSTTHLISREYDTSIPIGVPVTNSTVYILDRDRKLLPIGIWGELCTGGDGVAFGYLNSPELTSGKFIENPYVIDDRLYCTGDRARRLMDGTIEFGSRIDQQVKIRGFRIELEEIENRLRMNAAVEETVVVARGGEGGEKYICAYVVCDGSKDASIDSLKDFLSQTMPDYMVPSFFVFMQQFPLTPNGKINKKALPEPDITGTEEYVAPRNQLEQTLVKLWSEILGLAEERIGIDNNFFALGGHSLKATVLTARIHKELDVKVPLAQVFISGTVRELAKFIQQTGKTQFSALQKASVMDHYPLSSAQTRMYVLQQLEETGTGYNVSSVVRLEGDLDIDKLERTFQLMIKRHESFRTSFHMKDGRPVQIIHEDVPFNLNILYKYDDEVSNKKELTLESIDGIIKKFICPFELTQAPLLRVGLLNVHNSSYVLILDMHHIVSDGISMILFIREFIALYGGKELPPLNFQYKDFAMWKNSDAEQEAVRMQEAYWLEKFGDEIPILELPYDFTRPPVQSFEGASLDFTVDLKESIALNSLARTEGVTFFMLLLAVVNVWLAKLSGQEDIIIGTPIAGRQHADLDRIIGMFVNTLALRNQPIGSISFNEFLNQVKENTVKDFDNQDYQFEDIVEKVSVERDTSRNPLFDVSFQLQDFDMGAQEIPQVDIGEIVLKPYKYRQQTSKFDMGVKVRDTKTNLNISIEYATKLFRKATIEGFFRIFNAIVSAIVENPQMKLSDIDLLSKDEKQQLLFQFNDTTVPYASEKTIHGLFAEQVEKYHQNKSVIVHNQEETKCLSITYKELDEKSGKLASLLCRKGVTPESIVGIVGERSLEMVVGILAVLKVGGIYLPVDIDYPEQRIKYMLDDCAVELLLLPPKKENMDCFGRETIIVDLENLETGGEDIYESVFDPGIPAYIMYTSGSTGQPKGVLISHKNVIRLVNNSRFVDLTSETRILQTGAPVFDATTFEIWGSLLNGGQLILTDKEVILDANLLSNVLREYGINTLWLSSPLFNRLVQQDIDCFGTLNYLLVGGDVLSPSHINLVIRKYPRLKLINGYGPTENTTFSTTHEISHQYETSIPIGTPVTNSTVYILDRGRKLCPIGIWGELCTGGDGVAFGYINGPQLTSGKFIENPYVTGDRLYCTGDRARRLLDGTIEFGSRIDQQVKIRGFRIELGEIENRLRMNDTVEETVVVARGGESGEKYLCAYVVSRDSNDVSSESLKNYLSQTMPDYMVPSFIVFLKQLPLTPNGKINKKALPEPDIANGEEYVAPKNALEKELTEMWAEVLDIDQKHIGIDTAFFQLGGHSLKATVLAAKIHKIYDVKIPLVEIFRLQTVRAMAEWIRNASKSVFTDIEPLEKQEFYELSYKQNRLWVLQQTNPNSAAFNLPGVFSMPYEVDVSAVKEALNIIACRHDSFRTSFEVADQLDIPVQRIWKTVEIPVEVIDISSLDDGKKEKRRLEILEKERLNPFELNRAPLFRTKLVKVDSELWDFIYNFHHIITDGWSQQILKRDFMNYYDILIEGRKPDLDPLPLQYRDYAHWSNLQINDPILKEKSFEYWEPRIRDGISEFHLLHDFTGNESDNSGSKYVNFVKREHMNQLKKIASENNTTLFVLLYSIFNLILAGTTGNMNVVCSIISAGRDHLAMQDIVGFFVNSLMGISKVNFEEDFYEFLRRMDVEIMDLLQYQDYPIELVLQEMNVPYPNISVSFNMLNVIEATMGIEMGKNEPTHIENAGEVKFDLALHVVEYKDSLELKWLYRKARFEKDTIVDFANEYLGLITGITSTEDENEG